MIQLKNVSKFYYSKGMIASGFTKVNLSFHLGEFVAITGESGSGKSTLLNVISGLDTYEEGEMFIDGKETSHYLPKDWEDYRRKNIGNIYQNFNLINSYTVYQNIELVLSLNGINKKEAKEKVISLIKKVNLYKFRNTKVSKLSGGQKQRVSIARALAKNTPIIIADEPTGSLDKKSAEEVIKLLSEIAKEKLVIVVTHNYEQVEKYVTRKITMHDGKVLEDKRIKEVEQIPYNNKENYKNISLFNKIKLGLRNTFNIIPKFILLLIVYSFIVAALMGEYSSFKKEEYEASKSGYNYIFNDISDKRIIVNKKDRSTFTKEELDDLRKKENIDYILENDMLADEYIQLTDAKEELWIGGSINSLNLFKGDLDRGRLPEKENEVVILGSKYDYYLGEQYESLLNNEFYLNNNNQLDKSMPLKVVGIKYLKEDGYEDFTIYTSDSVLNRLLQNLHQNYSKITINFMEKNYTEDNSPFTLQMNSNVEEGKAYLSEDYNSYCEKENCLNKNFSINIENIYYKDSKNLVISKMYNKNNIKNLLNLNDYKEENFQETYNGKIYINPNDYNSLFNKGTYQISVYIKDINKIEDTIKTLEKENYNTLAIKDTLVLAGEVQAMRILKVIITIVLIITLFFISYFIIKLILKSRNIYFSIIRMLGGSKSVIKQLLIIELLTVANIAFILFVLLAYLNSIKVFEISFINTVNEYFMFKDYILLYIIITCMSILISCKYAKKLFKDSAMNTYREEI